MCCCCYSTYSTSKLLNVLLLLVKLFDMSTPAFSDLLFVSCFQSLLHCKYNSLLVSASAVSILSLRQIIMLLLCKPVYHKLLELQHCFATQRCRLSCNDSMLVTFPEHSSIGYLLPLPCNKSSVHVHSNTKMDTSTPSGSYTSVGFYAAMGMALTAAPQAEPPGESALASSFQWSCTFCTIECM